MLTEREILEFINEDKASSKKFHAREGLDYYEGNHAIRNYKLYYYNADGQLVEDKTRSNIKISHPFFAELVDQEVQYMMSSDDAFMRSDIPDLQNKLDEYFNENEDFISELTELLTGAVAKGYEYMYAYKNSEGKLAFQCADSLGVVEIESRFASDEKDHVIYWYEERVDKDKKIVKRIQVWDNEKTYFYTQIGDGKITMDENTPDSPNPRPHVLYKKTNDDNTYYEGLGVIPFFRLDNCKKQFSGLRPIKAIIDDYDLMNCSLSNNLEDFTEGLFVVKGFSGDNMDELIRNLKTKKAIGVSEEGDVDIRTVDIPYQARKEKMQIDEQNIFRFGMGLNTEGLKDTSATTNIAIKSAYSLLDLKCNKLEVRLRQFLRKILKVVLKEINDTYRTDYQSKDVYIRFKRETPANEQEKAQIDLMEAQTRQTEIGTLLNLQATLDNETLVQLICDELDIDYEEIKDKLPVDETEAYKDAQNELDNVEVDDVEEDVKQEAQEELGKALNGAQTSSLLSVIAQYKGGQLTSDEAVSIISLAIGISEEKARGLLHLDAAKGV